MLNNIWSVFLKGFLICSWPASIYSTSMTIFADGRNEMVNFSAAGIAYSKGDIVKITAQMSADTCTIGVPSLIVEGLNS